MWRPILLLILLVGSTVMADESERAVLLGDIDEATAWNALTTPWEKLPVAPTAVPEVSEELVRKTVHLVQATSDCYETRRLLVGYQPFGYYVVEGRRCASR